MSNLYAIYTVLFLLTASLGIELGFWLARRKFVDVSEAYEDLRLANARSDLTHWKRLWKRLDSLPEPAEIDLEGVTSQMDRMEHQMAVMSQRLYSMTEPDSTDLSHVYSQLNKIVDQLKRMQPPEKMYEREEAVDPLSDTDRLPALKLS